MTLLLLTTLDSHGAVQSQGKGEDQPSSRVVSTKVIVLCVHLQTKSTDYTEEERDQLLNMITNLTEEKDQQLSKITNQTEERDQQLSKITNFTEEKDHLLSKMTIQTEERDQLLNKNITLTNERDQFNQERNELWKMLNEMDGCIYQSGFYYMSSEEKSWTECRRYCRERGADLIIINNKEKEDFVMKMSGKTGVWMGLTDSDVEGRWTWVDGSTLTYKSWMWSEPNGKVNENCAVLFSSGWCDYPCNRAFKCICVKNIEKISN
ncbi:CD209 antigen-like protein C [Pimephales promelas]|uniref:CD209 antigen-like protein C n=1 Tax=Pimephales promelas TaxID=90988 RepID=UPI001955BBDC|nr:CD209 antigen-like protein C [Pimephales promelas]